MNRRFVLLVQFVCLLAFPIAAFSQWQPNGNPIVVGATEQYLPVMYYDGNGGTIIAWVDGYDTQIKAQFFNASGAVQWTVNGVMVTTDTASTKGDISICPDGLGGWFVAWVDDRNDPYITTDVYAQHITSAGTPQWNPAGIPICNAATSQYEPHVVTDASGGMVVVWEDHRSLTYKIYAQRVDASGTAQWAANGVQVCNTPFGQQLFGTNYTTRGAGNSVISDGAGGAIMAWTDWRNGAVNADVYAQRIDGTGTILWPALGVGVGAAANEQDFGVIALGGSAGAAIFTWLDHRNPTWGLYAQKISSAGTEQWTTGGVLVSNIVYQSPGASPPFTHVPDITPDGLGGAIVVFADHHATGTADIFTQRINSSGSSVWPGSVVTVCSAVDAQYVPRVISDGFGGAFITWEDHRSGSGIDVYAQRLNQSGVPQWGNDGAPMCAVTGNQEDPIIARSAANGAAIAWTDTRSIPSDKDIYVLRIDGYTPAGSNIAVPLGNPISPDVIVTYQNVNSAGTTTLTVNPSCSGIPNFTIVGSTCYDITSNVGHTGNIQVCIHYDDTSLPGSESALKLLHYDSGLSQWVDVTTSLDTSANIICGITTTLSPFAVGSGTTTGVNPGSTVPAQFALNQNVPNPFNPMTVITYDVPTGGARVSIGIYDLSGRLVRTLLDESRPAGRFAVEWDGRDSRGESVSSGVYFYRMAARDFVNTKKMILLK